MLNTVGPQDLSSSNAPPNTWAFKLDSRLTDSRPTVSLFEGLAVGFSCTRLSLTNKLKSYD